MSDGGTADVLRRFVEALGRGDEATVLAQVSDEFVLTINTAPRGVPRVVTGKAELAGLVGNIARTWRQLEVARIETHEYADDPNRGIVEYDVVATNLDGSEYRNTYVALGTVADGLITTFREYYDPQPMVVAIDALRAASR